MGLSKIIEMDPYLVSKSGTIEPVVRLLEPGLDNMIKVASDALAYSQNVKSKPGKTYILVLAMGSSEYYGPNRNGDVFQEHELKNRHHTFESNAHVFKSHVNKDPAKAIGRVVKSFYNDDMHRVELILELEDSKCPEIVSKIRNQQDVAVSMGCRIKHDVCTICGNKAPSRTDYCKHLRYEMNEIYPDGRVVAAENPNPTFFDISVVWRPADKTGYMMKKVAFGMDQREVGESSTSLGMKYAAMTRLSGYLRKAADIDKIITGVASGLESDISEPEVSLSLKWLKSIAPKVVSSYKLLGDSEIAGLSSSDFSETIKSLSDRGIFLMTPEFLDLLFLKIMGKASPVGLSSKLVSLQSSIFSLLAKHPEIPSKVLESGILDSGRVTPESEKTAQDLSFRSLGNSGNYWVPGSSDCRRYIPRANWDTSIIKIAGLAAIASAVYSAKALEACEEDSGTKLAHLYNVDIPHRRAAQFNKLGYLEHRTSDLCNSGFYSNTRPIQEDSLNLKYANDDDAIYQNLGLLIINA